MALDTELRHRGSHVTNADPNVPLSDNVDNDTDMKKNRASVGKTPEGQVFRVPVTREMVQSLLDPRESKSVFDLLTLAIMAIEIGLYFLLPSTIKQYLFIGIFLFWRLAYNVGLGVLLKYQSDTRGLVKWAKKYKLFDPQADPRRYQWLKHQLSMKMGDDYDFDSAPIEYNTWILFRQLVDIILMNDFTSYMCFALSWFNTSPQSSFIIGDFLRWGGGLFLVGFNVWVKLDAQRVVKDFAWYWGDFFFLIEQSLLFDGVFEMAPHPMYSVGYFGYYGVSLICASYVVLFVSIAAHALQFVFLVWVETPHIEKTYNPPVIPTRQRLTADTASDSLDDDAAMVIHKAVSNRHQFYSHYFRRDLIVFKNFDLGRSTDLASAVVMLYGFIVPLIIPGKTGMIFAAAQVLFWRIFHTYGLGLLLHMQSTNKLFTRHFVKWGGDAQEAFQHWKNIFNLSLSMTYVTFFVTCLKAYSLPDDWTYGTILLRHTLGLVFIALHIWTSVSIYEVLGDYGWFYGDFFIEDQANRLLYGGIYRFLNNPEKIMGHAAFWGMTLIANSWIIYALSLFSQVSNFIFLHYVEAPHMRKLYGDQIRKEAGLTKTLRTAATSIPKTIPSKLQREVSKLIHENAELQIAIQTTKNIERLVKETVEKVEKAVENTAGKVGGIMEAAKPRLQDILTESKTLLESSGTRVISSTISPIDKDEHLYSLTLADKQATFVLGHPIEVSWTAPENHGQKDWIGVYKVTANRQTHMTTVGSNGRWYWTNAEKSGEEGGWVFPPDVAVKTEGRSVFRGNELPWETGTYEFRYHHDGKHQVLARSVPFDICAPPPQDASDDDSLQLTLLKLVQSVLGNDPPRIPISPLDDYVLMTEQEAKRVVYAIRLMFGVEFAWEVVQADKCVARLAKRIQHGLDALAPFASPQRRVSLSTSGATET